MPAGKLSALQRRIIRVLAQLNPAGVLTGGAALAEAYLQHRRTDDVDLFWRARRSLGDLPREAEALLHADGLAVDTLQSGLTFHRLRVGDATDSCVVDLVADESPALEPPVAFQVEGVAVAIDSRHEIFVNKLCALLRRCELRDLVDVRALLDAGETLEGAVADAPRKDGGFSALTLAWLLKEFNVRVAARALGWSQEDAEAIERFRGWLADRLAAAAAPGGER